MSQTLQSPHPKAQATCPPISISLSQAQVHVSLNEHRLQATQLPSKKPADAMLGLHLTMLWNKFLFVLVLGHSWLCSEAVLLALYSEITH